MLKRNLLAASYEPTSWLTRDAYAKAILDYLVFGDAFFFIRRNMLGGAMRLEHLPAKYMRRGIEPGRFFLMTAGLNEIEYEPGSVVQIMQADVNQEIYGVPEYLSALQSALLNEAATLFRRRYYLNGSHAGYILYATGEIDESDTTALKAALKASKGPGNFRNLFVHAPGGKEGSLKILPIAEVGAKDEFLGIKNATRDDILAAHRTPPQLLGIVPAQGSVSGNPLQSVDMFFELEILPLQGAFETVNDQAGVDAVRHRVRERATTA